MMKKNGVALVISLLILIILTLFGAAIMMLSINKKHTITDQLDYIRALANAKAGIAEAVKRLSMPADDSLNIQDPETPYNPDWKVYILLTNNLPSDSPPVYFRKSIQMDLPDTERLNYTTTNFVPNYSLLIHHKRYKKAAGEIFYYNWKTNKEEHHNPLTYSEQFFPVEVIEVTGREGNVKRRIRVEIQRKSVSIALKAALSSGCDVEVEGKLICCGHNHKFDTPYGTDMGENPFECFYEPDVQGDRTYHIMREDGKPHAVKHSIDTNGKVSPFVKTLPDSQCRLSGCLPGVATASHTIKLGENTIVRGNPDWVSNPVFGGFNYLYRILGTANWKELGDNYPWQILERDILSDTSLVGFFKRDGDLTLRGNVEFTGVLWITGNLKQNGKFNAKGLIYAGKGMRFDGNVWILGGVVIEGKSKKVVSPVGGRMVILYSEGAIQRAIALSCGYSISSWSEK